MWLAMCFLFPELWEEFNGKCPTFQEMKLKYDGHSKIHNRFIEQLSFVEQYTRAQIHSPERCECRDLIRNGNSRFLIMINDDRQQEICKSLISASFI